jgi:hypothetical protein
MQCRFSPCWKGVTTSDLSVVVQEVNTRSVDSAEPRYSVCFGEPEV